LDEILDTKKKELLFHLMPLNIEARYPTDKDEIARKLTKEYSEFLFNQTKDYLKWMKPLLIK